MLFATIDFEASSLTGWPIEVGWMREGDAAPRSMLIRPEPIWSMDEWDTKAEAVHKIPIETLCRDGVVAAAVLLELTRELKGYAVVSDAPIHDTCWLGRLAHACHQDWPFRLWSINDAIPALAARAGISVGTAVKRYVENAPKTDAPHRAGPTPSDCCGAYRASVAKEVDEVRKRKVTMKASLHSPAFSVRSAGNVIQKTSKNPVS